MMKLLLFGLLSTFVKAQEIKVNTGSIEQFSNFKSKYVAPRNINVWLPDGYSSHTKYAVLYMHDGQMLFDPSTTWNKQAWNVDDVSGDFLKQKNTQQFIIVGIWNNPEMRHQEYFPEKAFNLLTPEQNESVSSELEKKGKSKNKFVPISNLYLKFIVEELKPFIDKSFYTNPKQSHTFIAGSSMGGLISLYAICEYPTVFGGAACLSTHWTGTYTIQNNPIPDSFANYLKNNLPKPSNHKIYFDYGDLTLDALYKIPQEKIDVIMKEKGFTEKNWMTKFFPGKDHSENSWQERFVIPISFLFQKKL